MLRQFIYSGCAHYTKKLYNSIINCLAPLNIHLDVTVRASHWHGAFDGRLIGFFVTAVHINSAS